MDYPPQKKKFLARLPWERTDIVDRKVEAKNILAFARCKKLTEILPKYYTYIFRGKHILSPRGRINLLDGTMVMEYIEDKGIDGKDLEKTKIQEALLKTLYTFHTSRVRFVNIYDAFQDEVLKYRSGIFIEIRSR